VSALRKLRNQCEEVRLKDELEVIGFRVAKELRRILEDLVQFYCYFLWGDSFEDELIRLNFMDRPTGRTYSSLADFTLGKLGDILTKVSAKIRKSASLKAQFKNSCGRASLLSKDVFSSYEEVQQTLSTPNRHRIFFVYDRPEYINQHTTSPCSARRFH
jgi:hypothetical protein